MDFYRVLSPIYEICEEEGADQERDFVTYESKLDHDWSDNNVRSVRLSVTDEGEIHDPTVNGGYVPSNEDVDNEAEIISLFGSNLGVIHEDRLFDDRVNSLKYFIHDEGITSANSTPQVPQKYQQDPLIRHWFDLCIENNQEKNELDKELMGYNGNTAASWEECVEKRLGQLHEKQARLHKEIQKQLAFLSRVPGGDGTVQELACHLQEIYRNSLQCYSNSGDVAEERISEHLENEPKDHTPGTEIHRYHAENKEESGSNVQFDKVAQDTVSSEIYHRDYELYSNAEKRELTSKSTTNDWCGKESENSTETMVEIRKMKVEHEVPCRVPHQKPGLHHNDFGYTGVKLPPIHTNLQKQTAATGFSSQQSKSACKLPEIATLKKTSRSDMSIPSVSDSNQTLGRESPKNPRTQNRSESRPKSRRLSSPMSRDMSRDMSHDPAGRTGTRTPSKPPSILPPLMNIPKSSKEIRDFFQVPKRKGAKKPQTKNAHNYDILIIEHNQEKTAPAPNQFDRIGPSAVNNLSSISGGNFLQNEMVRKEEQALYYKSERAEKILVSSRRRHKQQ